MGRSLALVAVLAALAARAEAQSDTRLAAAVRLAQDGQSDSARAVVRRLLDATEPTDSLYPEILYTSGLVAGTDSARRLALRRVIVEYSQSGWADDALLLLGQTEYANGNPGATLTQVERLVADYPNSPLRAVGALWGARAAADLGNPDAACRLADAGLAAPNDDVELKNQLEYQKQRCTALATGRVADSARATIAAGDTTTPTGAAPPPDPVLPAAETFGVQIAAAPTRPKADAAVASLKRAGFPSFVVQENGLFKVRAGPYPTRVEAQRALIRVRSRLGGKPFVVPTR